MVAKRSHQPTTKGKTQKKARIIYEGQPRKMGWLIPVAIIIILILAIGLVIKGGYLSGLFSSMKGEEMTGEVLVTVNGEPIYLEELDLQWDALPPQTKLMYTRDQLLEELIQEKMLLQEAEELGLTVSEEEVDEFINTQMVQVGITLEQLEDMFTSQGTTVQEMKGVYQKQLTVAKLFDTLLNETINATDEEIEEYYDENVDAFFQDEQVTVQHILVEVNENFNVSQAQERVDMIIDLLDEADNENFCTLVSNYSSDFGSIDNCGEYTFAKGVMVPEFEEAGFDMEIGERRVVPTTYGLHIMLKTGETPAGTLELDDPVASVEGEPELKEIIRQILIEEKAKEIFDTYLAELTAKATIEYPQEETEEVAKDMNEEEVTEEETEMMPEEESEEIKVDIEVSEASPEEESVEEEPEMMPEEAEEENTETTTEATEENNSTEAEV